MIACLRAARFLYPDRSAQITVELRRLHDIDSDVAGNKRFSVAQRAWPAMTIKNFASLTEARRDWCDRVRRLEDQGLSREDVPILGFHEED